jgi:radical SAM protein with 4Fe4S-binding SPASM domain
VNSRPGSRNSGTLRYYLAEYVALKALESPSVYDIRADELYELDEEGFAFLRECAGPDGCDPCKAEESFAAYALSEGLLTGRPVNKKRPLLSAAPAPSLRYLELQITDKCNLTCKHCYLGDTHGRELSPLELKKVLDEFEAMQGLRLMITGGEPLMHGRFREFNELLPEYAFRKILFTNGLLLDRDMIRALRVDEVQLSVDGMARGHDYLRGPGSFQKVMKALEAAVEEGMAVSVATMIHEGNIGEFEGMKSLFLSLGIRDWTVDAPSLTGNLGFNSNICAPPETGGKLLSYGFGRGLHGSERGFGCGLHLAAVIATGEVCKCAFYSDSPSGNIREGLAEAWARIRPVDLGPLRCSELRCPVIEECRGGCRYRASIVDRAPSSVSHDAPYGRGCDFYKCYYYGIMNSGMKPGNAAEINPKKGGIRNEDQEGSD